MDAMGLLVCVCVCARMCVCVYVGGWGCKFCWLLCVSEGWMYVLFVFVCF